jgi:methyl-accepting chemotaxis protein
MMKTKEKRRGSIRLKVLVLPLVIMFLVISVITATALSVVRSGFITQMREDGMNLTKQIGSQIESNYAALDIMSEEFNSKIRNFGRLIAGDMDRISDSYLIDMMVKADIDEINVMSKEGEVIYSTQSGNLGYVFDSSHPGSVMLSGQRQEFFEDIRKSKTSENYYKYGYVTIPEGGFVQVGILANKIQRFSETIDVQALMEKLSEEPGIVYALLIDKDLKAVAHSNRDRINVTLEDTGSRTGAVDGKVYTDRYNYEAAGVWVFDVVIPFYRDGSHVGAINIGFSMENVNRAVQEIVARVILTSLLAFIAAAAILWFIANSIVKPVKQLAKVSESIAKGDLTSSISIKSNDEVGTLADSFSNMTKNLRESMKLLKELAGRVKDMSDSLAGNSDAMASTVQEVAGAVNDVAKGASDQASNMSNVAQVGAVLTEELDKIYEKVTLVKNDSQGTEEKALIGKKQIDELFKSIDDLRKSFEQVSLKVGSLNKSVSQVGSITGVINSISEQTNLLALNAAIEAARAGESGRGFAVVADEVRKLAEQSKESTEEIQRLVSSISMETTDVMSTSQGVGELVARQVETAEKTMAAFNEILNAIKGIGPLVEDTYKSLNSTIASKNTVVESIESVTAISEETSASSEEIAASTEEMLSASEEIANFAQQLNEVASKLNANASKFTI